MILTGPNASAAQGALAATAVQPGGPGTIVPATGWTAATTAGDKTTVLAAYTNGVNGTMVSALNVVSAGTGTALSAALDQVVILTQQVAALRTALLAGTKPNA